MKKENRYEERINIGTVSHYNSNIFSIDLNKKIMFNYGDVYIDLDKLKPTLNFPLKDYLLHFGIRPKNVNIESIISYNKNTSEIYIKIDYKLYYGIKKLYEYLRNIYEGYI